MAKTRSRRSTAHGKDHSADSGPARWLTPFLEARYSRLAEKPVLEPEQAAATDQVHEEREQDALRELEGLTATRPAPLGSLVDGEGFRSVLQPGRGSEVLVDVSASHWRDLFEQYRGRQAEARRD